MSLRDGTKKMSKSEESDYSRINLKDSADEIVKKIKKAKTDADPILSNELKIKKRPEALNLLSIYSDLSDHKKFRKLLQNLPVKIFLILKINYLKNC